MNMNVFRMPEWYPKLKNDCFPTAFLELDGDELEALKNGQSDGEAVESLLPELKRVMSTFRGPRFFSVDTAAPTDTARFKEKRGAVYSEVSAWKVLTSSEKIHKAAADGLVSSICIRPFRRMQPAREFRLFIRDGKLVGMSQYWLIRHFRRLPGRLERYWKSAQSLVERIAPQLPVPDLAMDIYFKKNSEILIIDLNPWGSPTDPLMYSTWDRDWSQPGKCEIVPPPHMISGNIDVRY